MEKSETETGRGGIKERGGKNGEERCQSLNGDGGESLCVADVSSVCLLY